MICTGPSHFLPLRPSRGANDLLRAGANTRLQTPTAGVQHYCCRSRTVSRAAFGRQGCDNYFTLPSVKNGAEQPPKANTHAHTHTTHHARQQSFPKTWKTQKRFHKKRRRKRDSSTLCPEQFLATQAVGTAVRTNKRRGDDSTSGLAAQQ